MKTQKLYSLESVGKLIAKYEQQDNFRMIEIEQGVLGYGTTILIADNCKTIVIRETYLNEWSSAHTVRMYNSTPKKFAKYLD